jgi:uncharacterized repeat protein (TIGR03803 family)
MRARLLRMLASFCLLILVTPASFAQIPAPAPAAWKSAPPGAPDVTEQTVYSFCAQGFPCVDGNGPSGLVMDAVGNLYGTTTDGGADYGVAFMLSPNAGGTGWTESVLYTFCAGAWPCTDGYGGSRLVTDKTGTLYGMTGGGAFDRGSVFALTPNQSRTAWTYTLLYSFCPLGSSCRDGEFLSGLGLPGALLIDKTGVLYGVAAGGNANSSCYQWCGVIFQLAPNASRTAWTETVLYRFCAQTNCSDGASPGSGLLLDDAGNLYGATEAGGNGYGVVFELTTNQDRTSWTYTILHSFCAEGWHCVDGAYPNGNLVMDQNGALYGTTYTGGNYIGDPNLPYLCGGQGWGCGTVFQLVPDQTRTSWTKSVLYRFCSDRDRQDNCLDGSSPYSGPIIDAAGNLYGTTYFGGPPIADDQGYGYGTVFRLTPAKPGWTETTLHRFCVQTGCPDGAFPVASLIIDGGGNLYGSVPWGANFQNSPSCCGAVFAVSVGNSLLVSESGNGRVISSPAGIDCPGSCGANFAAGTQVALTASPASGSSFSGWGGACSGAGSCVVTMNSSQSVTAVFSANYALSVSVIGSPGGRVTSSPSGIDCGATCSASFAPGAQVTLTATSDAAWGLAGWSGACSGIASGCSVTLKANTSAAASFAPLFGIGAGPVAALPADAAAPLAPIIGPIPQ